MARRLPELCARCKYRGFLDPETQYECCDYLYVTGHARSALPPREDGLCPGFEEGEREYSQIVQTIVSVKQEHPMKYDGEFMRSLYEQGATDAEIAEAAGCSRSAVFSWRRRNGLEPHPAPQAEPQFDREVFMALYRKGYSDKRIALLTGCSATTVGRWRLRNNLPMVEISQVSKRVVYDRKLMQALYDQGMTDKQIADAIGCGPTTVQRWRMREGLVAQRFLKGEKKI